MTDTFSISMRVLEHAVEWVTTSGLRIVVLALGMLLLMYLLKGAIAKLRRLLQGALPTAAQLKRADTLTSVVRDVARILILALGSLMILSELGIDMKPLLAAAGLSGLAIGFGAQSLVKDVITGFFILLENQIRVGDVVEIAGVGGLVE